MSIRIMALATVAGAGLVCLADAFAAGPEGPSFDCAKAQRSAEKAICADARLSAIDRLVAEAYKTFEPAHGGNKKAIAGGLVADRDACMDDITCIAAVLNNALETYRGRVPWVASYTLDLIGKRAQAVAAAAPQGAEQPMPRKIAECTLSPAWSLRASAIRWRSACCPSRATALQAMIGAAPITA